MRLIWAGMIILGLGGYSVTSAAQDEAIYSWKDEDGTIHFSETPPEGVDATAVDSDLASSGINVRPKESSPPADSQDMDEEVEIDPRSPEGRRMARDERRAQSRETQAEREELCAYHRQQIAQLEPSPRVLVQDRESGEVYRLDDNTRLEMVEKSRKYVEDNCD